MVHVCNPRCFVIPVPNTLKQVMGSQNKSKVSFFDPEASGSTLKWIVSFKWNMYGRFIHSAMLALFLVLCCVYGLLVSAGCTTSAFFLDSAEPALAVSAAFISALFLLHEGLQALRSGRRFLGSRWNWCDVLAHCGVVATALAGSQTSTSTSTYPTNLRIACGWVLVLLSVTLLGMLRPYEDTGALVRMLTTIISDMRWFFLLQVHTSTYTHTHSYSHTHTRTCTHAHTQYKRIRTHTYTHVR